MCQTIAKYVTQSTQCSGRKLMGLTPFFHIVDSMKVWRKFSFCFLLSQNMQLTIQVFTFDKTDFNIYSGNKYV